MYEMQHLEGSGTPVLYKECPKKIVPFFIFFPWCPMCGEWCKLHWLLLDTASFDWNTRRSRGHKIFKMTPTKQREFLKKIQSFSDTLYRTHGS
jgi:hypothetical protein